MEKNIEIGILFEYYGKLLSKKQFEIMNDYVNNDLTLTEIAQNNQITRQAVKDMVKKVEEKLVSFEEKLEFKKSIQQLQSKITSLIKAKKEN